VWELFFNFSKIFVEIYYIILQFCQAGCFYKRISRQRWDCGCFLESHHWTAIISPLKKTVRVVHEKRHSGGCRVVRAAAELWRFSRMMLSSFSNFFSSFNLYCYCPVFLCCPLFDKLFSYPKEYVRKNCRWCAEEIDCGQLTRRRFRLRCMWRLSSPFLSVVKLFLTRDKGTASKYKTDGMK